jgi:hypothetical protein
MMNAGESFGAETRAADFFLMAWKSGCSVPASDIIICTEYMQDLYRQLYTLESYMLMSADILIMCQVFNVNSHIPVKLPLIKQVCNSSEYILHTELHEHQYLLYYGFVLVGQTN